MNIIVLSPGEGRTISLGPIQMVVQEDGTQTRGTLGVAEFAVPAHAPTPPPHLHHGIAAGLSRAHVLVPTHPGFAGEPRSEWFDSIDDLALAYLDLLERLDLRDVLVTGSSMGGWIASAMALRDTSRSRADQCRWHSGARASRCGYLHLDA